MATNNAINLPIIAPVSRGGTGASTLTSNAVVVSNGTSPLSTLTLTDGQLLIGSTGNAPVPASLTAGANVTITPSAGGITIAASAGAGFSWSAVTGDEVFVANNGYIANGSGVVTFTLPTDGASAIGDTYAVTTGSQQWVIAQLSSQQIRIGSSTTTVGTGGSLASSALGDGLSLVKISANLWQVLPAPLGNITVV